MNSGSFHSRARSSSPPQPIVPLPLPRPCSRAPAVAAIDAEVPVPGPLRSPAELVPGSDRVQRLREQSVPAAVPSLTPRPAGRGGERDLVPVAASPDHTPVPDRHRSGHAAAADTDADYGLVDSQATITDDMDLFESNGMDFFS